MELNPGHMRDVDAGLVQLLQQIAKTGEVFRLPRFDQRAGCTKWQVRWAGFVHAGENPVRLHRTGYPGVRNRVVHRRKYGSGPARRCRGGCR